MHNLWLYFLIFQANYYKPDFWKTHRRRSSRVRRFRKCWRRVRWQRIRRSTELNRKHMSFVVICFLVQNPLCLGYCIAMLFSCHRSFDTIPGNRMFSMNFSELLFPVSLEEVFESETKSEWAKIKIQLVSPRNLIPFLLDRCSSWPKTIHACERRLQLRTFSKDIWNTERICLLLSIRLIQWEGRHLKYAEMQNFNIDPMMKPIWVFYQGCDLKLDYRMIPIVVQYGVIVLHPAIILYFFSFWNANLKLNRSFSRRKNIDYFA